MNQKNRDFTTVQIGDFMPKRTFRVRNWMRDRASHEFARYVDRRLPVGSADAYKESPRRHGGLHRRGNPLLHAQETARRNGWGGALSQKKASLRRKYRLTEYVDVNPRFRRDLSIEPLNTYTGMFT